MSVIAIVGPTASGKSALADALASSIGGEVICADSMQVYRGMDIGTSKTPASERSVPYHCLDLVDPGSQYTAALYQRDARAAIEDCRERNVVPIICGGTGLYIRAALDEFDFSDDVSDAESEPNLSKEHCSPAQVARASGLRQTLEAQAAALGAAAFHALLAERDPQSAALIHPHNVRRVVRAFELLAQGKSYAVQSANMTQYCEHYPTTYIGIQVERELLYQTINQRVHAMIDAGLLAEVEHLMASGFEQAITSMQGIGYKELVPVVKGTAALADAIAQIQQSTRRYAKRQLTWFRRDKRILWLDATDIHNNSMADALTGTSKNSLHASLQPVCPSSALA